jgi:hypothetical protein
LHYLVFIMRHGGVDLSIEQLIHDHILRQVEPSARDLVGIANASGMQTKLARSRICHRPAGSACIGPPAR